MQQTASLIALCVACAVVGALAALLVETEGRAPGDESSSAALADAVDRLARQVEALERRVGEAPPGPTLAPAPSPAAVPPGDATAPHAAAPRDRARPRAGPDPLPDGASHVRRDVQDPPLPPTNGERVDEVGPWRDDPELRARWLLASERSVLAWFGAPDGIWGFDGGERWEYKRMVRGVRRPLNVYLLRGRVVRMSP